MSSISRIKKLEDKLKRPGDHKITVRICCCDALAGEDHDPECPCSEFNGHDHVIRIGFDELKDAHGER